MNEIWAWQMTNKFASVFKVCPLHGALFAKHSTLKLGTYVLCGLYIYTYIAFFVPSGLPTVAAGCELLDAIVNGIFAFLAFNLLINFSSPINLICQLSKDSAHQP